MHVTNYEIFFFVKRSHTVFLCMIMKRKLKCIPLDYVMPSDKILDTLKIDFEHTKLKTHARTSSNFLISLLGKKK